MYGSSVELRQSQKKITTLKRKSKSTQGANKPPPRPTPGSVTYDDESESDKAYDHNPDESSLTEKPSEISSTDSQVRFHPSLKSKILNSFIKLRMSPVPYEIENDENETHTQKDEEDDNKGLGVKRRTLRLINFYRHLIPSNNSTNRISPQVPCSSS